MCIQYIYNISIYTGHMFHLLGSSRPWHLTFLNKRTGSYGPKFLWLHTVPCTIPARAGTAKMRPAARNGKLKPPAEHKYPWAGSLSINIFGCRADMSWCLGFHCGMVSVKTYENAIFLILRNHLLQAKQMDGLLICKSWMDSGLGVFPRLFWDHSCDHSCLQMSTLSNARI